MNRKRRIRWGRFWGAAVSAALLALAIGGCGMQTSDSLTMAALSGALNYQAKNAKTPWQADAAKELSKALEAERTRQAEATREQAASKTGSDKAIDLIDAMLRREVKTPGLEGQGGSASELARVLAAERLKRVKLPGIAAQPAATATPGVAAQPATVAPSPADDPGGTALSLLAEALQRYSKKAGNSRQAEAADELAKALAAELARRTQFAAVPLPAAAAPAATFPATPSLPAVTPPPAQPPVAPTAPTEPVAVPATEPLPGVTAADPSLVSQPPSSPAFPVLDVRRVSFEPDQDYGGFRGIMACGDLLAHGCKDRVVVMEVRLRHPTGEPVMAVRGTPSHYADERGEFAATSTDTAQFDRAAWKSYRTFIPCGLLALPRGQSHLLVAVYTIRCGAKSSTLEAECSVRMP